MTNQKRKSIDRLAYQLRTALEVTTPVDLVEIVEKLGGKVRILALRENYASGKVTKVDDSFEICVNPSDVDYRVRFTIAHELGHLFIHMGFLIDDTKWASVGEYIDSSYYRQGHSEEEYEANLNRPGFSGAFIV